MTRVALSIAGSDPSGGAGVQVDLKTFQLHGVYGEAVISLLTAQNSLGVREVEPVSSAFIQRQLDALLCDMPPHAIKTGALPSAEAVYGIAQRLRGCGAAVVVDPVLRPTRGVALATDGLAGALVRHLLPLASLVTPNTEEAGVLTGGEVIDIPGAIRAARGLVAMGAGGALVKGGHLSGEPIDVLLVGDGEPVLLHGVRVDTPHTHGTGCVYSAAIAARLARGQDLVAAVRSAKAWLQRVVAGPPLGLGRGNGPLNLWAGDEVC